MSVFFFRATRDNARPLYYNFQMITPAVTRIKLAGFRNYATLDLKLEGVSVALAGGNGAGKTNLLEAVSLLAPGRGMRGAQMQEMDRNCHPERSEGSPAAGDPSPSAQDDNRPWSVFAEIRTPEDTITIGTGRDAGAESEASANRRIVKINGTVTRGQAALSEHFAVVSLTPAMDQTFAEGATSRRTFLDRLSASFYPDHVRHHAIYTHAKSERLRLLSTSRPDPAWLSVLERRLAEHGLAIAAARLETVALLQAGSEARDSLFPQAILAAAGAVERNLAVMSALEAEELLATEFAATRARDAASGQTSAGIHRSDFLVTHGGKRLPAEQCSTGEQKALLLSIILAAARARKHWRGSPPILLFDEVAAHLDVARRTALYAELDALGAQCWMTATGEDFFADFPGKFQLFRVDNGRVIE